MLKMTWLQKRKKWLIAILILTSILAVPRLITAKFAEGRIKTTEKITNARAAIVFGAGLRRDGSPTAALRDRVIKGVELYEQGKAEWLIMSGAAPEPEAMRELALQLGVPNEAIILDDGGLRTYDSCFQAVEAFGLKEATLVTQAFHLPRALYVCDSMGLSVEGVAADRYHYRWPAKWIWNVRETLATVVAMWDVHVSAPTPASVGMPASDTEE